MEGHFTEPRVLRSAAGFYIGTMWLEDGFEEPGDRLSDYFADEGAAMKALPSYLV